MLKDDIVRHQLYTHKSLYDLALDLEVSESTLYNYMNNYKPVKQSTVNKISKNFYKMVDNFDNNIV